MSVNQSKGRQGRIAAMWCALVGAGVALALVAPFGGLQALVGPYALNFAIALGALFASAWLFGGIAGHAARGGGWSGIGAGLLLGFGSLTLSVLAGSVFTFFSEGQPAVYGFGSAAYDYIVKPLFWVLIVGFVPCVLLAFLFARLMARASRRD